MGETPRGRVDEEAAAATGPGTATTDHIWTDGVSLVTPASSPRDDQTFELDLVKPPPPPTVKSTISTTSQQAHDTAADIANPHATCAEPTKPAGTSRNPPVESEPPPGQSEATSQVRTPPSEDASDGEAQVTTGDEVEGRETDDEESRAETSADETAATSASARSASLTRHDEAQCEMEGPGEGDDEERRPGVPDEPSDEPNVEPQDPQSVQVEPGGETEARRNECAAHEDANAEVNGEVAGTHRDVQVEVESAQTRRDTTSEGERARATAHTRSTTTDEETGQRTETDIDDVPEDPPDPSTPFPMPDQPARPQNEPPSVELEGERRTVASCDVEHNGGEADASGASDGVEDDGKRPMDLRKTLERVSKHLKPMEKQNSPDRPGEEPEDPGGEMAVPDGVHDVQEGPLSVRNERADETDAPRRDTPPGGPGSEQKARGESDEPGGDAAVPGDVHSTQEDPRCETSDGVDDTSASCRDTRPGGLEGEQEESRGVEVSLDRQKDVDGAEYDGNRPRSEENEHDVDTNALRRDRWPGGRLCERGGSGAPEGWRRRQI
jgi:hypothetical protein